MLNEKTNASQFPRIFYARHMQPGPARYEDETILVDTDAMKRMLPSAVGKPVYIHHQPVDLKNMKEEAAGYITDAFYNELDGWAWFKIIAIDDECHNAIKKGWRVSNAYRPTQFGSGGTKNNVPFDREVLNGDFTHLAIVPDPRYEEATIMAPDEFKRYQDGKRAELAQLQNSLPRKGSSPMFKLFKHKREEVNEVDGDCAIELANGKTVTIAEMIKTVEESQKAPPQTVMVNGKEMPLADLVAAFENACSKKNAEDDDDDEDMENGEDADKADKANGKKRMKKNADEDDEDDKKKDGDKENAKPSVEKDKKHFDELKNAALNAPMTPAAVIDTSLNQVARGKARYGSQKA